MEWKIDKNVTKKKTMTPSCRRYCVTNCHKLHHTIKALTCPNPNGTLFTP